MNPLASLLGKLNPTCRAALARATERCMALGQHAVEIDHLLIELLDDPGSELIAALARYELDGGAIAADLRRRLGRFASGNAHNAGVSGQLATGIEAGWIVASIELGRPSIGSASLLRAWVEDARLREPLIAVAPGIAAVPRQRLADDLAAIVAAGHESGAAVEGGAVESGVLRAYTGDLTQQARDGKLDRVVGREAEIDRVIETLMRRRQNNPLLAGGAGVGKTAIVEGLAQRIADGQVPPALAGVAILALDLGALQAGAGVRGEFEQRLRDVLAAVAGAPAATILFVDEAHMLVGAGGAAGQGDAANLLKPALARGGLRTIAATTWAEYKRYFEKDAALARRFQPIRVAAPSVAATGVILRHLADGLEAFHGVRVTEEAITDAARLSDRYIPDRQLPDKAIGVLDTACARVAIAQGGPPRALDAAELRCTWLEDEMGRLDAGAAAGRDRDERFEQLGADLIEAEEARDAIAFRWEQERYTVARIHAIEAALSDEPSDPRRTELQGLRLELAEVQGEDPLVPVAVDARAVADVIADWTGIPLAAIRGTASAGAGELRAQLAARVVGQEAAVDAIVRRVLTFQADLGDPTKPTGVFLLCGPSGVGKTETAMALADLLLGGARSLITVNMSEYQEAHSVSGLKGAPPGYAGYGKGGVLTEAVRRQPYSVVLLDEVEKAHADVLELFFQVFDRGMLEDSDGLLVDFTHTLILLTSNVGADLLDGADVPPADMLKAELLRHFPAAFLARLIVVPYRALSAERLRDVARMKLDAIAQRYATSRRGTLRYDEAVVAEVARQAAVADGGARSIDAILSHQVLPELSARLLDQLSEPGAVRDARVCTTLAGGIAVMVAT